VADAEEATDRFANLRRIGIDEIGPVEYFV
jgi:hypothetical protein